MSNTNTLESPTGATAPDGSVESLSLEVNKLRKELSDARVERAEFDKLRKEIADARIERAAKHLELMRNWMTFYTACLSLVFIVFGVIGWRGYSDIQTNKERVEAASQHVAEKMSRLDDLLANVDARFDAFKKKEQEFDRVSAENARLIGNFGDSLRQLESKQDRLDKTADQIRSQLRGLEQVFVRSAIDNKDVFNPREKYFLYLLAAEIGSDDPGVQLSKAVALLELRRWKECDVAIAQLKRVADRLSNADRETLARLEHDLALVRKLPRWDEEKMPDQARVGDFGILQLGLDVLNLLFEKGYVTNGEAERVMRHASGR